MSVSTAGRAGRVRLTSLSPRRIFGRVLREPLVHFMVLGALIFGGVTAVRALDRPTVTLDAQELNQLVEYWQLQSGRPPTPPELKAMIQERVDEELLAREAERLGMDKGDMIIRRRLAQKMAFASEDTAAAKEPSDAALQAYFQRNTARYASPERVAVRHVFFSADRGLDAARTAAAAALAEARAGKPVSGDPSLLPLTYADVSLVDLGRDYGDSFAAAVKSGPIDAWQGPVQSSFGFHLIDVQSRSGPALPAFDAVRSQVRDDYVADERKDADEAFLTKLRAKYRVSVAGIAP